MMFQNNILPQQNFGTVIICQTKRRQKLEHRNKKPIIFLYVPTEMQQLKRFSHSYCH
jgi:hypothetical protein